MRSKTLVREKMAELVYNVDEKDNVIGPIDRDRAHREELLHRAGVVFLLNSEGKVLIQHRSPEKKTFPDLTDCSCAFHVTFGESYEEGARRELKEETGTTHDIRYVGKFHYHVKPENEMVAVFISVSDEPIQIAKEENTSARFVTKEEIDNIVATDKITPWFKPGWDLVRSSV